MVDSLQGNILKYISSDENPNISIEISTWGPIDDEAALV